MDLSALDTAVAPLFGGVALTLELLFFSALGGLLLASIFTALKFHNRLFARLVNLYIFIMRGTPMLVQFYFVYYGLGQWQALHDTFLWPLFISPVNCAVLALAMNTGAYTTVILHGAFAHVPMQEKAAGLALGLTNWQIFKKITLPRAIQMILPLYNNELLMLLKGTSLASTITVLELTGVTEQLIGETYETMLYWLVAGAIYLAISGVMIGIFKVVELRYRAVT